MDQVLQWMHPQEGAWTALLTAGLLITSVGMMIANVYLARETSLQRKAGTEPDVVGYLLPDRRHINIIRFHLKNVGRGTAVRVKFDIEGSTSGLRESGVRLPLDRSRPPISMLPQDEGVSIFFGTANDLLRNPQPVALSISYENAKGHSTRKRVVLDVRQFEGFVSVGTRPEDDIADALKKIERHLGDWGSGFRKLNVVSGTAQDWRKEDEYQRRLWEEEEQPAQTSEAD